MGNPESGTPLTQMVLHCYHENKIDMLDISIVQYFIEKGANLSRVITAGFWVNSSVLDLSVVINRIDVAKMLVKGGG